MDKAIASADIEMKYPLYIWHEFMGELHSGMEYADFVYDTGSSDNTGDKYQTTGDDTRATKAPKETIDPSATSTENALFLIAAEFSPFLPQ